MERANLFCGTRPPDRHAAARPPRCLRKPRRRRSARGRHEWLDQGQHRGAHALTHGLKIEREHQNRSRKKIQGHHGPQDRPDFGNHSLYLSRNTVATEHTHPGTLTCVWRGSGLYGRSRSESRRDATVGVRELRPHGVAMPLLCTAPRRRSVEVLAQGQSAGIFRRSWVRVLQASPLDSSVG